MTRPVATPALVMDNVSASYGPYRALFGVSFSVPAGEVVALLGSNGSGKSTIARVATGLLSSTSGKVLIDGNDVTNIPAYRIARLGVAHVTEGRGVFGRLTVEENLELSFRQRVGKAKVAESLEVAFDAFPILKERRSQHGSTLTGGQQRLLSLAKVLVVPPRLLVADELSLGLAPIVIDAVYEGLDKIRVAGTSILVVEQQIERALHLATAAVVIEHGSVAFEGPAGSAKEAAEAILLGRAEHKATHSTAAREDLGDFARVERRWRWSRAKDPNVKQSQGEAVL